MKNAALIEAERKLAAKQKALADIFAEAGPDRDMSQVKSLSGDTHEKVAEIRKMNAELNDLAAEVKNATDLEAIAAKVAADHGIDVDRSESGDDRAVKAGAQGLGDLFVKSGAYKTKGTSAMLDVDVKTVFSRSAGWTPESTRSGLVVDIATRPIQVTDLIPTIPTSQAAYKYMEETTFTNAAAERAEAAAYAESAFALTERSVTIETIGTFVPVTDEQLEDEAGAAAYLNRRLQFGVRQRLDGQILTGDGSTPNILGINNKPSIGTQAKGADSVPDAVYKGIVKSRVAGRAMPNAVVMHPNDWQGVRLLTTTDGVYIWGSPSEAGPARIWGLPVVETDAQTENTAVVGDFANFSLLVIRRGLEVQVSNSNEDYFIKGKQAVRAGIRCATVWTRAAAFVAVSGI